MLEKHLKKIIKDVTGKNVSEEKSLELFKSFMHGISEHAFHSEGNIVDIEDIGRFGIIKRNVGGGREAGWPFIPKLVFYTSVGMDVDLEKRFKVGGHKDNEVESFGIYREEEEE